MPKVYQQTNFSHPEKSGGATGSGKVQHSQEKWIGQLKPPIKLANIFRRVKARDSDTENYSELIASHILRAATPKEELGLVPEVSFVTYDKAQVGVISHYVPDGEGDLINTKDNPRYKDTQLVVKNPDGNTVDIKNNALLHTVTNGQKVTLLKGIARSILVGDHDINPGNFVKVKEDKVARIDFGHAFNDLIKLGGVKNINNQVLDYINREHVDAGIGKNSLPKLWRSYENFVPSKEFADALLQVSQEAQGKIAKGIENAKQDFIELLEQKDIDKVQVLKSLVSVANNLGGPKIKIDLANHEKTIDEAFTRIQAFSEKQAVDMEKTAKIMQAQVDLDQLLKKSNTLGEFNKNIAEWQNNHGDIIDFDLNKKITWIKASKDSLAVTGTVRDYIKASGKRLGLDQQQMNSILASEFLPRTGLLSRLRSFSVISRSSSNSRDSSATTRDSFSMSSDETEQLRKSLERMKSSNLIQEGTALKSQNIPTNATGRTNDQLQK